MAGSSAPLTKFEVGSYEEIAALPNPEGFGISTIPSLSSILLAAEKKAGKPLTEAQVLTIRDKASVLVTPDHGALLVDDRGYTDINPQNAWQEWQALRVQFNH